MIQRQRGDGQMDGGTARLHASGCKCDRRKRACPDRKQQLFRLFLTLKDSPHMADVE